MSSEQVFVVPRELTDALKEIHENPRYRQDLGEIYKHLYLQLMNMGKLDIPQFVNNIELISTAARTELMTQQLLQSLYDNTNIDLDKIIKESPRILSRMIMVVYSYENQQPAVIDYSAGSNTDAYVVDPFQFSDQGEFRSLVIIGSLVTRGINDIWRFLKQVEYINKKLIVVVDESWYQAFKHAFTTKGVATIETVNPINFDWSKEVFACTRPAFSADEEMSTSPKILGYYKFD